MDNFEKVSSYYHNRIHGIYEYDKNLETERINIIRESTDNDILNKIGWDINIEFNTKNLAILREIEESIIGYRQCCIQEIDLTSGKKKIYKKDKDKKFIYVVLTQSGTLMSRVIQLNGDVFTHASISLDSKLQHMYSFNLNGFVNEDISMFKKQFGNIPFAVYAVAVTNDQLKSVKEMLNNFVQYRPKYKYNFAGILGVILNTPITIKNKMFCSEFVANVVKMARITVHDKTTALVRPEDFHDDKSKFTYKVFEGKINDYNHHNIDKLLVYNITEAVKNKEDEEVEVSDDIEGIFDNRDDIAEIIEDRDKKEAENKAKQIKINTKGGSKALSTTFVKSKNEIPNSIEPEDSIPVIEEAEVTSDIDDIDKERDSVYKNIKAIKKITNDNPAVRTVISTNGGTMRLTVKNADDLVGDNSINKKEEVIRSIDKDVDMIDPSVIKEAKEFPVQFDKEGNLLIKNIKKVDLEDEYQKSHKLLIQYNKVGNIEGMKYEISKLYFISSELEVRIKDTKKYSEGDIVKFRNLRARCLNDFSTYLKIICDKEKDFNFTEYYNNTPFSDKYIAINKFTLKYVGELLKNLLKQI